LNAMTGLVISAIWLAIWLWPRLGLR